MVDNNLTYLKGFYIAKNHPNASCKTIEEAMKNGITRDPNYKKICMFFYSCMDILLQNVNVVNYPQSMIDKVKRFKEEYINKLLTKHNHVHQIREILRYGGFNIYEFEKMLEERKYRQLANDLCSAIELVLQKKFHLQGDLQETMIEYTKNICKNEEAKPLLHKLRKYRNKCVYSNIDLDYEEPTYVEFKYLVNYVSNFGYGEEDYE